MPLSDSDSLPDLATVLASHSLIPNSAPQSTSKRRRPGPRPKCTAKPSEPIQLTSDDEPKSPLPKRKRRPGRKSSSANIIDLCSDDHEVTPRRPRKNRKSQARASREDEIIVLMSSDNEEPPASCAKPSSSKIMNGDHKGPSPAASIPPIEVLHPEEIDFAVDTGNACEQPEVPVPQMDSSPASPVVDGHEAEPPTDKQAKEVSPDENKRTSGPLQHIYNEAFQNASQSDEVDVSSPVFSWKTRPKPIQVCEPRYLPPSNPPLLTPGFFKRVQKALSAPQNPATSVQNDLVKGSPSNLQRPTTPVKSDPVPSTPSCATSEIGKRGNFKPFDRSMPQKSQPERVMAVEEITEDDPPGNSPADVIEAGALHITSPSSPVKEPTSFTAPQSEVTEQSSIFNVHDTTSTIDAARRTSPSTPLPKSITASKSSPIDSQEIKVFGPSEADIQEIEAMLLPEASNDMTDEELLAIGLRYPEY